MKTDELPSKDKTPCTDRNTSLTSQPLNRVIYLAEDVPDHSKEKIAYLRRRLELTRRMVITFVELAGRAQAPSSDDLFKQCQEVQAEVSVKWSCI